MYRMTYRIHGARSHDPRVLARAPMTVVHQRTHKPCQWQRRRLTRKSGGRHTGPIRNEQPGDPPIRSGGLTRQQDSPHATWTDESVSPDLERRGSRRCRNRIAMEPGFTSAEHAAAATSRGERWVCRRRNHGIPERPRHDPETAKDVEPRVNAPAPSSPRQTTLLHR